MSDEENNNKQIKYKTRMDEIKIPKKKPFEFDLLDRKPHIETLTNFVKDIANPTVIAINGRWGNGKTTFVKMWQQYLEDEDIESIYFNAWENDLYDDAFSAIFGEISSHLGFDLSGNDNDIGEKVDHIIKRGIIGSVKFFSAGTINIDDEVKAYKQEFIGEYTEFKKNMVKFKSALLEKTKEQGRGKNIIFFIDELDRCRPPFAIEILEKIKHIFNIDNIVFVLSINMDQLQHSVQAIYGSGIDAKGYLSRFIDLQVDLPWVQTQDIINSIIEKGNWLSESLCSELIRHARGFDLEIFSLLDCSVRDMEKILLLATTVFSKPRNISDSPGGRNLQFQFVLFLTILKYLDSDILHRLANSIKADEDYPTILNKIKDYETRKRAFLFMYSFHDIEHDFNEAIKKFHGINSLIETKVNISSEDYNRYQLLWQPNYIFDNANFILSFSVDI
jgi:KAP family P-loop domain